MDRISNLPDGIVIHILSFLSLEEAAPTSLLSKRWRDMFAFTPNLSITSTQPRNSTVDLNVRQQHFVEFVDRVLAVSGNSAIRRCSLNCCVESSIWKRWILNVLNRGVLELRIYANPSFLFDCKTLVKLKLYQSFLAVFPENASLPALKFLRLSFCHIRTAEVFEKLISACPSLEELIIDQISFQFWELSHILSSLSLKRLHAACFSPKLGRVSFDHPNLVFLEYAGHVNRQYPVVKLDSLVEAVLELVMVDPSCDLSNLIKGLRNVKKLNLRTLETVEIFGTFLEAMPVFKNLIHLSVRSLPYDCLPGSYVPSLDSLLKKFPKLQTLVIYGPLRHNDAGSDCKCFVECTRASSCPVKVLELTVCEGTIKELEQIKHFLEELSCLELVKVRSSAKDDKEKMRLTTDLETLARAYSKCKIQVEFYRKPTY